MRPSASKLGTLVCAVALMALVPALTHATMIIVYSKPQEPLPLDEAAATVRALILDPGCAADKKFSVFIAQTSILTADYSVPPGVSAYFWSDEPFVHQGFVMRGVHATFENAQPTSIADTGMAIVNAPPTTSVAVPIAKTNEFLGASMDAKRLQLRYTLSTPGRVFLEIYGMNGQNFGRWGWEETSSGHFEKSVDLSVAAPGMVMVRWRSGEIQATRRVIARQ